MNSTARDVAGDMLVIGRPPHQVILAAADGSAAAIAIHKAFVMHSIGSAQQGFRERPLRASRGNPTSSQRASQPA